MPSARRKFRHIYAHYRQNAIVYQIFAILGLLIVGVGGTLFATKRLIGGRETIYEQEEALTEEEIEEFTDNPEEQTFPQPLTGHTYGLRDVVRLVIEAQSGRGDINSVLSVRRVGVVEMFDENTGKQTLQTSILTRNPDKIRYTYVKGEFSIAVAYNGESGWKSSTVRGERQETETIEGYALKTIIADLETMRPLNRALADLSQLRLEARETVDTTEGEDEAQSPYRVVRMLPAFTETLVIDPNNFLVIERELGIQNDEGEATVIHIEYSDFRYADGLAFAYNANTYIDGELRNVFAIDSVEVNVGALPYNFEAP